MEFMIARVEIDGDVTESTFNPYNTRMNDLITGHLPAIGKAKDWMIEIIDPTGKLETLRIANDPAKCTMPIRIL